MKTKTIILAPLEIFDTKTIIAIKDKPNFLDNYCKFAKIAPIAEKELVFALEGKTMEVYFCKTYVKIINKYDPNKKVQLTYNKAYSFEEIEFRFKKLV
jgi:hypothetical protein